MLISPQASFSWNELFTYDLSDFKVEMNNKFVYVSSSLCSTNDFNVPGEPDLPFCQFSFFSEKKCDLSSLKYEILEKQFIASDVILAEFSANVPLEQSDQTELPFSGKTLEGIYPKEMLHIYNGPEYFDNRIVLSISPFLYDADDRTLYFIRKISVSFSEIDMPQKKEVSMRSFDCFDYLIITHDSLKSNFNKLKEWKTIKGVKTRIVTLDSIHSWYGRSNSIVEPIEIKSYIDNCYQLHGVKMFLLGGSSNIVPSQVCMLNYNPNDTTYEISSAVSDYYYSCLYGDLDWDRNGNRIVGEIEGDGVILTPTVSVSRLPIENNEQLSTYINKLLQYEKNPNRDSESSVMLSGSKALWYRDGKSDAQIESEMLFDESFQSQYININKYAFYDTGNNLNRHQADSIINADNIIDVINTYEPHFLNIYSHGSDTCWNFTDTTIFSNANVPLLNNEKVPMVITTIACNTANFHGRYPCLAESLIQHPHGGALAFWGSSDSGLGHTSGAANYSFTPSMDFITDFWSNLVDVHNFGQTVFAAKKKHLVSAYSIQSSSNWLLKTMNALGDCEVPIYTERPHDFNNVKIRVTDEAIIFADYADLDSCMVAVSSIDDNGESFFVVDIDKPSDIVFNDYGTSCNICLTKANYVPFHIKTGHFVSDNHLFSIYLQNETFSTCSVQYDTVENITIGSHADNLDDSGEVVVKSGAEVTFFPDAVTRIQSGFRCEKGGKLNIGISTIF